MKKSKVSLLVVVLVLLFASTESIVAQQPIGLSVSDPQINGDIYRKWNRSRNFSMLDADAGPVQEVSALFQNIGSRAIKSVIWEYIHFKGRDEKEVSSVITINSDKMILPGESARLTKKGYRLHDTEYPAVRVIRVEYTDGAVWNAAKTKR